MSASAHIAVEHATPGTRAECLGLYFPGRQYKQLFDQYVGVAGLLNIAVAKGARNYLFLWRMAFKRLRRLCLAIFLRLCFLRFPMIPPVAHGYTSTRSFTPGAALRMSAQNAKKRLPYRHSTGFSSVLGTAKPQPVGVVRSGHEQTVRSAEGLRSRKCLTSRLLQFEDGHVVDLRIRTTRNPGTGLCQRIDLPAEP